MTEPDRTLFPWASVIRFGLARLRLPPETFWRLSLVELRALISTDDLPAMTTRRRLEALMRRFPDAQDNLDAQDTPDALDTKESVDGR